MRPEARRGGERRGRWEGRRRRSQQLSRREPVGIVAHDGTVRGIPPGPLPGDLGVGGARSQVSSRDGPQGVAAANRYEVVGRRRRSGCRRQQSGEVGVVDRWRSRRDVARAGRRRGDCGLDGAARWRHPALGRPSGRSRASVRSVRTPAPGRSASRCRPRGPRGPCFGRPDRTRRPTREPAAAPASRPRPPAPRARTLRIASGVTRSPTLAAARPAAPGSSAATASREPSASQAASSTPTHPRSRSRTSSGRAAAGRGAPCRTTVISRAMAATATPTPTRPPTSSRATDPAPAPTAPARRRRCPCRARPGRDSTRSAALMLIPCTCLHSMSFACVWSSMVLVKTHRVAPDASAREGGAHAVGPTLRRSRGAAGSRRRA